MPFTEVAFLTLPPHFDNSVVLSHEDWIDIVPGYLDLPNRFRTALPFLLASLVYHTDWLQANLSDNHPLFNSRYWRNTWHMKLKPHVLVGLGKCPVTHLQATGIPPHLVIAGRLQKVEEQLENVVVGMKRHHDDIMDNLPHQVVRKIQEECQINGMREVSHASIVELLSNQERRITGTIQDAIAALPQQGIQNEDEGNVNVLLHDNIQMHSSIWKFA